MSGGRPFCARRAFLSVEHLLDVLLGERVLAPRGAGGAGPPATSARSPASVISSRAARAAPAVDGLGHLLEVVDLVLVLDLRRARRPPVDLVDARARVEDAEQDHADEEAAEEHDHDDDERVHAAQPTARAPAGARAAIASTA